MNITTTVTIMLALKFKLFLCSPILPYPKYLFFLKHIFFVIPVASKLMLYKLVVKRPNKRQPTTNFSACCAEKF